MPPVHVMRVKLAYHILELVLKFVNIRCLKAKQLRKTSWMNPMKIHLWHVLQTLARTSLSGLPFPIISLSLRGRERGSACHVYVHKHINAIFSRRCALFQIWNQIAIKFAINGISVVSNLTNNICNYYC